MDTVGEIKSAVTKLSREELSAFRNWFQEYDSDAWDKEIEEDVAEGRLDAIAEQAMRDLDKYIREKYILENNPDGKYDCSPEFIKKLLKIVGNNPEKLHGYRLIDHRSGA